MIPHLQLIISYIHQKQNGYSFYALLTGHPVTNTAKGGTTTVIPIKGYTSAYINCKNIPKLTLYWRYGSCGIAYGGGYKRYGDLFKFMMLCAGRTGIIVH